MYMDPLPWIGSSSKELGDVFSTFILWYVRSLLQLYFILDMFVPFCTGICMGLSDVQAPKCNWSAGRIGEVFLIFEAFERL